MNKIRVIDLLNKIANGEEVPKEIKLYTNKYQYYEDIKDYKVEDIEDYWLIKDFIEIYDDLIEEVAIIEDTPKENKKIERVDRELDNNGYLSKKLNEIIDKINVEK